MLWMLFTHKRDISLVTYVHLRQTESLFKVFPFYMYYLLYSLFQKKQKPKISASRRLYLKVGIM